MDNNISAVTGDQTESQGQQHLKSLPHRGIFEISYNDEGYGNPQFQSEANTVTSRGKFSQFKPVLFPQI